MEPQAAAWLNESSWPIVLGLAAFACAIWCVRRWRHHREAIERVSATKAATPIVYTDAPTVRLDASQRIDRLHRVVSLKVGEHADLLELTFDRVPRLRIELQAIERSGSGNDTLPDYARIAIELGGAQAGCGSRVKEIGANCFLVPRATQDEQRSSILHFHGRDEVVNFLRIKVLQLYPAEQSAEIDVLHVCGQWPK